MVSDVLGRRGTRRNRVRRSGSYAARRGRWMPRLLARLRNGDEEAFVTLVGRYQQPMLRLARSFAPSQAVAEEAVQDTWLGLVRGIERFEGRSSFKTWLFPILVNRARSAGTREPPSAPTETLHAVDPSRFDAQGQWADPLGRWMEESDERLDAAALLPIIRTALDDLPPRQRQVVLLRDVEGLSHDEACSVLGISAGNQRLLLHRGRSRLRELLEAEMGKGRLMLSLRRRDIVCQQAVELITDYLEGALSRRDRRRLEAHLRSCPNCATYLEQIKMTIELTGSIEPDDLTPEARVDLTELYRRWRSESSSG